MRRGVEGRSERVAAVPQQVESRLERRRVGVAGRRALRPVARARRRVVAEALARHGVDVHAMIVATATEATGGGFVSFLRTVKIVW